ncbi:MAG: helix-turn-helix transcriptional regulator [Caulobacteraceae bacterium]|nr:helix-turn-helix transcriptional regulator [Caulobacteraceae bacterium]
MERAVRNPTLTVLDKIAAALGVPLAVLVKDA